MINSARFFLAFVVCQLFSLGNLYAAPVDISDKGVGIVTEVTLDKTIDAKLVEAGKTKFNTLCIACHKMDERFVGPALRDVTKRRSPEWIMNMIIDPAKMTTEDPIAQELLAEFLTQMATLNLSKEEARALLEFLRDSDARGPEKKVEPLPTTKQTKKKK